MTGGKPGFAITNAAGRQVFGLYGLRGGYVTLLTGVPGGKHTAMVTMGPQDRRKLAAALLDGLPVEEGASDDGQ